VLALLVETIGQADPARAQGDSLTVRETLEHSADQARVRLRDHPLAEATLLDAVGTVYAKLGLYEQAEAPLRRALELRRAHYPRGDPEVARSEMHFGELSLHRGDYETARRYLEDALAAFRRDGEHPAEVAALLLDLARLESDQGDPERAERLAREALALQQDALGEKDVQFASTLDRLGSLAYLRGDYASAEDLLRQGLEVRRLALGESHPETLDSLSNLAHVLDARGAAEESTRLLREVLAARRRVLGEGHPEVAAALNNLGSTLSGEGRFAEAEPLLQEAVRIAAAALAPSNVAHATYLGNLAQAVQGQGRAPDATALYRRALEATEAVHGRDHPDAALALHNLASALDDEGDSPGAEALYWEALAIYDRTLPPDHLHPTFTRLKLARIAIRRGDAVASESLLRDALAVRQAILGSGNWRTAAAEVALGQVQALTGRRPDAEALTDQAWRRMAGELGADNPYVREAAADVAATWQRLGWTEPARLWQRRAGAPDPDFSVGILTHGGCFQNSGHNFGTSFFNAALWNRLARIMGQRGRLSNLTHQQQTVTFGRTYANPVVIAQSLTANGSEAAAVRITGVKPDRFTLYVDEPPNLDGAHPNGETVSYLVLEAGQWVVAGQRLAVGSVSTSKTVGQLVSNQWQHVNLSGFGQVPVVLTQVQSNQDPSWVKTRVQNVSTTGFDVALEEEEASAAFHGTELVGWLAFKPGASNWDGKRYEAVRTPAAVTDGWYTVSFLRGMSDVHFLSGIESYNGPDAAHLRYQGLNAFNVQVRVEEDTTRDGETTHNAETVAYVAIAGSGTLTGKPWP
jgi:tetratricopeptide (TPR) repeat protein